jgi:hypothetical protein
MTDYREFLERLMDHVLVGRYIFATTVDIEKMTDVVCIWSSTSPKGIDANIEQLWSWTPRAGNWFHPVTPEEARLAVRKWYADHGLMTEAELTAAEDFGQFDHREGAQNAEEKV